MGKKKIVFLASTAFIYNDAFFPVLLYLASIGVETRIFFETQRSLKAVKSSTSLWSWLNKYAGDIVCFEGTCRYVTINNLIHKARKTYFMLSVIFCKEAIVFSPPHKKRFNSILDMFSNVWYYYAYAGFDLTERKNMVKGLTSKQRIFTEKHLRPLKPIKVKFFKKMIFLNLDKEVFNERYIWDKRLIIPYPLMQSWWHGFVKENPPKYHRKEMVGESGFITIIMIMKGLCFFENGSDVDVLLDEIISAIRKYYPDTLIVIKPKGHDRKYWLDDDALSNRYQDKNIVITHDALMSLSCKTAFAISTGQSSGNYYMLSRGVPVIEYCRYSEGWREIFPKETSIEEYGGVSVKDINSLEACIKNIMNHKIDLGKLKEKIGYKDIKLDIDLF